MNWTPQLVTGSVLLLLVTVAAICFLPSQPAWNVLGQVATGAVQSVFAR